jgi:hypothetical protein
MEFKKREILVILGEKTLLRLYNGTLLRFLNKERQKRSANKDQNIAFFIYDYVPYWVCTYGVYAFIGKRM